MPKNLLSALSILFIIQCNDNSTQNMILPDGESDHISVLDNIPQHIQEIDNLNVFPGDAKPQFSIALVPEQTYGKSGEPYLTNVLSAVIDDQGKVIVLDTKSDYSHVIQVFNDDGSYHTQLSGPGKGPGEYGLVGDMKVKSSKLYVFDITSLRLNEYSTENYESLQTTLTEQWKKGNDLMFGFVEPRSDGNFLVNFTDIASKVGRIQYTYYVMDATGNRISAEPLIFPAGFKITSRESVLPGMPLSFMGKTITTLSGDDVLHSVWTPEFLIKKYDSNGNYLSAIYYPIQGLPFNLDDYTPRSRFEPDVRDVRNAFDAMGEVIPETFPVVETLKIDDENRIWVAVPMDTKNEMLEWWILAPSGDLLAKLQLPSSKRIFEIKKGFLYSKEIDENSGVEFVVKNRIELSAGRD
jgi:hypothetical protein